MLPVTVNVERLTTETVPRPVAPVGYVGDDRGAVGVSLEVVLGRNPSTLVGDVGWGDMPRNAWATMRTRK